MGTQQALTTEQIIILDIIDYLEKYNDDEFINADITKKLSAFSWDSVDIDPMSVEENLELLEYFKYISADRTLTYQGRQYLMLSKEYAKRKYKKKSFISINKFAILDIEKLGVILDVTNDLGNCFKVIKNETGKLVITIQEKIKKMHK